MTTDLNKLYSEKRTGIPSTSNTPTDTRTVFQRDYDRIIFSSAFRRLQNKTQVFPLPGSVFVHNRLTHSLEVSSVGRSLGSLAGTFIAEKYAAELSPASVEFYNYSLYNVISSACLCHDIGNPAFGHSGEDAIASYFIQNTSILQDFFSEKEWADFIHFEGNSNAIRILTQQQNGKTPGGLLLTYTTLAAIAKYPCEAIATSSDRALTHRKKFGFFQSEKTLFRDIALQTNMLAESEEPLIYKRHPFVWLTEAADDICYNIIDLEDAHRLGIISHQDCVELFKQLISELNAKRAASIDARMAKIEDKNDQISYLRAKAISVLIDAVMQHFEQNFENIRSGIHQIPLWKMTAADCATIQAIEDFSVKNIYDHHAVVEIENAGYNVMFELLDHFIPPMLKSPDSRTKADKKALQLIPYQFNYPEGNAYQRVMGILDFISGMTDNFATELYRRIKGIEIGFLR